MVMKMIEFNRSYILEKLEDMLKKVVKSILTTLKVSKNDGLANLGQKCSSL
jgi:hydrogenase maturation factor HypF (carbamoyltransferase family)